MKKILAVILCALMTFSGVLPAFAVSGKSEANENTKEKNYIPNEVIVMQRTDFSSSSLYSIQSEEPLPFSEAEVIDTDAIDLASSPSPKKTYSNSLYASETRIIKGTVEYGTDIEELCKTLEKRDDIISADPNYIQSADSITVPEEALQSGADYNAFNWYKNSLNLTDAWQSADTLGSRDVVVGVIDTGVNIYHKEFEDNLWDDGNGNHGWNAVDDNYDVSDTNGHGSNVAGIIAMGADNGGYVGISPKVSLMALKASYGTSIADSDILECLNYAVENGADIINMSFGSGSISSVMASEYQKAARKTVLIAAAGNSSESSENSLQFPAACGAVLGVMSYGSYKDSDMTSYNIDNGKLSSFSNFDPSGKYYEIAAPGVEIMGVAPSSVEDYSYKSGTSQATPIVSGTAALYLSLYPDATPYQVREAITDGSDESVGGYYDSNTYKKINIKNILSTSPKEDEKVSLSADALTVLSSCYGENINTARQSDLDALSIILTKDVTPIKSDLSALSSLNTALIINLSSMALENGSLSWLNYSEFGKLYMLNINSNPLLCVLGATQKTAPMLLELHCEGCSFEDAGEFSAFRNLRFLYANHNLFKTSEPFKSLKNLALAELNGCLLQDTSGFENLSNLQSLDISENYITDISPLSAYRGSYLDISSNPLNLGAQNNLLIKSTKNFMNDNSYSYNSVNFYYYDLNGDENIQYIPSETISFAKTTVARTDESTLLKAQITPENANVNTACLYETDDKSVTINPVSGKVEWKKESFNESKNIKIKITPTSSYPSFGGVLTIAVPEIEQFTYSGGTYTLKTSIATESVKIGNITLTDYTLKDSSRYFSVPESISYSASLSATPSDSIGSGKAVVIGTEPPNSGNTDKAEISDIYSDSDTYSTGDSGTIYIKASESTNFVKVKNCRNSNVLILSDYTLQGESRIFSFSERFTAADEYKFKAYASGDGNFKIGASVLKINVLNAVKKITLTNSESGNLYFSENNDTAFINASFYPENAETGKDIIYSSSDESIASVDPSSGKVTAKGYGTALISAENENGLSAFSAVSVCKPLISDTDITAAEIGQESTFEVYTDGAENIKLCLADNSEPAFTYTIQKSQSEIAGYDTKWIIKAVINTPAQQNIKIYASDRNGADFKKDNFSTVSFSCTKPMSDFEIVSEKESYNRNDGSVKITVSRTPLDSNSKISWSISSNTVAALTKYADYCYLTPKASGTVTLSATATINSKSVTKTKSITFSEGKIENVTLSTLTPSPYSVFTVTAKTDRNMRYMHLYDCTNLLGTEYSDPCYYKDEGEYRIWTLPFYFMNSSEQIRVWGGDSIGNISSAEYIDISCSMPSVSTLASSKAYYCGNIGTSSAFEAITLPSKEKVNESNLNITVENQSIAKYENGKIYFLSPGETVLKCASGSEEVSVPISVYAPITEINLPYSELTLCTGATYKAVPNVAPENYTDELTFSSSNENIFTTDENGNLEGIAYGDAVLSVTSRSGVKSEMKIRVRAYAFLESMNFENGSYSAYMGDTIYPKLITDKSDFIDEIYYSVSNTNIISDLGSGRFKALKEGTATITAYSDGGLESRTTVTVSADKRFSLNRQYIETAVNSVVNISAAVTPGGADFDGALYSDNEQVATVTQSGYIYTKSPGTCNIIYIAENGESVCCLLKVNGANISRFTVDSFEENTLNLSVNENHIVGASLTPRYATESLKWESDDEKTATVDQNGNVTGISVGTATITVSALNGKQYSFSVNVTEEKFCITGNVNGKGKLILRDIKGNSESYDISGDFSVANINKGIYTAEVSALHHTSETISEVFVNGNTSLGKLSLHNGDTNGDGSIDISDISLILQTGIYSSSAENKENYDINDDGFINVSDISLILLSDNYSAQSESIIY